MPKDFLNAAGSFGEAFFKTLQSEQERQDKLKQQQQEFAQKTREMNLLNAYRNKALSLDQSQFETKIGQDQSQFEKTFGLNQDKLLEDQRQFDLGLGFKQSEADRNYNLDKSKLGLGYAELNLKKKALENTPKQRSEVDQRQVEELFGKVSGYLDKGKSGVSEDKYPEWKQGSSENVSQLLEKVGVPINGDVTNYIRSVIDPEDNPETKRKLLNEAINSLYSEQKITEEQKRALQLWKELGTR